MAQPILEHAIVTGERAALRPVRDADAPAAFAILHRRREVLDWLIWSGPEAVEDMREHYARWCVPDRSQGADRRGLMDDPETGGANYHFAITEPDGEFRGALTLRFLGHAHTGDLGYWIAPEAWNRGLGTEALRLAAWLAFERLEAVLLYARVFEGNDASARILAKNGYTDDHVTRIAVRGEPRRMHHWSLSRSQWRERFPGYAPVAAEIGLRGDAGQEGTR